MTPYRVAGLIQADGSLVLRDLPFRAAQRVEVVIVPLPAPPPDGAPQTLRGTVLRYDNPTEPVAVNDWEAGS
jgi:hypothetical protein